MTGFRSHRSVALLAYLIQESQPHSRMELATLLWPDHSMTEALGSLRRTLHDLVQKLPGAILAENGLVSFDPTGWTIDVVDFLALRANGDEAHMLQALDLGRGEFLAGIDIKNSLGYEYWLTAQREIYRHHLITLLERLLDLYLAGERYNEAMQIAWRLLSHEPWRERIHRVVMRLLVRSGRRNSALRQYQLSRRFLAEELAIEPSAETEALYQRILRSLTLAPFRPPTGGGPFVGRAWDITRLRKALIEPGVQLITISGSPGSGKTRLAMQMALLANSDMGFRFLDGICYVDVGEGCRDSDIVAPIWAGLGLPVEDAAPSLARLQGFLRGLELLLILDNFSAPAHCLADLKALLEAAPDLVVVAITSAYLGLSYESHCHIEGLSVVHDAEGGNDARRLFLALSDRAGAGPPNVEDIAAVDGLCRLVQGNPLAIQTLSRWSGFVGYRPLEELLMRLGPQSPPPEATDDDFINARLLRSHCTPRECSVLHDLGLPDLITGWAESD